MQSVIEVLRSIEWKGEFTHQGASYLCCPKCYGIRPDFAGSIPSGLRRGHSGSCELAAALQEHAPAKPDGPALPEWVTALGLEWDGREACQYSGVLVWDTVKIHGQLAGKWWGWPLRPIAAKPTPRDATPVPPELPPHIAANYQHCDPPEYGLVGSDWDAWFDVGFSEAYSWNHNPWSDHKRGARWRLRRREPEAKCPVGSWMISSCGKVTAINVPKGYVALGDGKPIRVGDDSPREVILKQDRRSGNDRRKAFATIAGEKHVG